MSTLSKSVTAKFGQAAFSARAVSVFKIALLLAAFVNLPARAQQTPPRELIYIDPAGVMRWGTSHSEVAMFGANYCLPSACDYRAAEAVHADKKKLIERDMEHFARMGWDAVRLSFWGDWENCDKQGNLINNDHLDLLDYLIFQAKRRDMHMLLSPIVTYDSLWPDGKDDGSVVGFSRFYPKSELGTNPAAIAAQVNYLKQLLNHVNPYTGLALKNEPYICYLELINEPYHHAADFDGSVKYIYTLVDAVRSTGCQKITFYNVSQDFAIGRAIAASNAGGSSFAWYPTGLLNGRQLQGNFLPTVDSYSQMLAAELSGKPKAVYEFDMADVMSGYHYPAMVRTFRSVGAQFAAMFSYDMLATAPYNLGWQTHCLNMVYTPQKAVSAIIASQVMRRIPRLAQFGSYPDNTRFGDFRVSYEQNLSELLSKDAFEYSNNTQDKPPAPAALRRIVGFGSSPIVHYEGEGLYFLDRLSAGAWRLEVYPDAIQIGDPFAPPSPDRLVFRLIPREWPMTIALADLTDAFTVEPLDEGNKYATTATAGRFIIKPGVYLLTSAARTTPVTLPEKLNQPGYVGIHEFVRPEPQKAPLSILLSARHEFPADQPFTITARLVDLQPPKQVELIIPFGNERGNAKVFPMERIRGYEYAVTLPPAGAWLTGAVPYLVSAIAADGSKHEVEGTARFAGPASDLELFDAGTDAAAVVYSRTSARRGRATDLIQGPIRGLIDALRFGLPAGEMPEDFTASRYIGGAIADRGEAITTARSIQMMVRGITGPCVLRITLVEKDGSAWSAPVAASGQWKIVTLSIADLKPARSVMLPQGYPGSWAYWLDSPPGKKQIDLRNVERLQFSLRKSDRGDIQSADAAVAIENISLEF